MHLFFPPCNTKNQKRVKRTYSWRSERLAIWSYLYVCDAEECNHKILIPLYKKKKENSVILTANKKGNLFRKREAGWNKDVE